MPFTCSRWDASNVLKVDPNSPSFTCVGYAPSKGRRCRNAIAAANCHEASKLLTQMSRLDPSSSRLDDMLETLAPRLLCRRWHQNQAHSITEKWNDRIDRFRATENTREETREVMSGTTNLSASLTNATRSLTALSNAVESSRELLANYSGQALLPARISTAPQTENPVSSPEAVLPEGSITVLAAEVEAHLEPRRESLSEHTLTSMTERADTSLVSPAIEQETVIAEASRDGHGPAASQNSEESESNPATPVTLQQTPVEDDHPEGTRVADEHNHRVHHPSRRRRIEGDCSICCEVFRNEENLVWCRTQCGQNYHRECISLWLETDEHTKTCPYW